MIRFFEIPLSKFIALEIILSSPHYYCCLRTKHPPPDLNFLSSLCFQQRGMRVSRGWVSCPLKRPALCWCVSPPLGTGMAQAQVSNFRLLLRWVNLTQSSDLDPPGVHQSWHPYLSQRPQEMKSPSSSSAEGPESPAADKYFPHLNSCLCAR